MNTALGAAHTLATGFAHVAAARAARRGCSSVDDTTGSLTPDGVFESAVQQVVQIVVHTAHNNNNRVCAAHAHSEHHVAQLSQQQHYQQQIQQATAQQCSTGT
jgi:hypothetical protein